MYLGATENPFSCQELLPQSVWWRYRCLIICHFSDTTILQYWFFFFFLPLVPLFHFEVYLYVYIFFLSFCLINSFILYYEGCYFYVNQNTNESSWTRPSVFLSEEPPLLLLIEERRGMYRERLLALKYICISNITENNFSYVSISMSINFRWYHCSCKSKIQ